MTKALIQFSEVYGKFEGIVDGNVVTRCADRERVVRKLVNVYGVSAESLADSVMEKVLAAAAKPEFSVQDRFDFITQFTKLVARGVIPGLVITGSGGLGKTHTVMETLSSMNLVEDTIGSVDGDYVFVKGYSTARNLYTTLFNNNGKIIVFDDCDVVFKDPIGADLFKGALDSHARRVINWGAESKDESIPARFEFTGKVIFISNLEMSKFPQPILSRSMLADLTLSPEEKVERIEHIFAEETQYTDEDKEVVLAFIKKNIDKFKDLNIRSAFNTLKMKVAIGKKWERMALYSATLN